MDPFKKAAKDIFTTREGALGAASVVASVAGAYFFWPAAVAGGVTMNAPSAAGFVISRAAFLANPQLYFQLLCTVGAKAAAAAFAPAAATAASFAPSVAAAFTPVAAAATVFRRFRRGGGGDGSTAGQPMHAPDSISDPSLLSKKFT